MATACLGGPASFGEQVERESIEDSQVRHLRRCIWPQCDRPPLRDDALPRPVPLCIDHTFDVWHRYAEMTKAIQDELTEKFITPKSDRKTREAAIRAVHQDGAIYFIRLNDVIKIGWTSQLHVRLRDYTAGAVLLAHHPGTRADERDLHRTFKPFRVHGREWYDGSAGILLDHIAGVVAKYGPPQYSVERKAKQSSPLRPKPIGARRV